MQPKLKVVSNWKEQELKMTSQGQNDSNTHKCVVCD